MHTLTHTQLQVGTIPLHILPPSHPLTHSHSLSLILPPSHPLPHSRSHNHVPQVGSTPLHTAASQADMLLLKLLVLEGGADASVGGWVGCTLGRGPTTKSLQDQTLQD